MKLTPRQELAKWTIKNNQYTIIHAKRQQGLSTCLLETAIEQCIENSNYYVLYLDSSRYHCSFLLKSAFELMVKLGKNSLVETVTKEGIKFVNGSMILFEPYVYPGYSADLIMMDNFRFTIDNCCALIPLVIVRKGKMVIGHNSEDSINLPSYFTNLLGSSILKFHKKLDWREFSPYPADLSNTQ